MIYSVRLALGKGAEGHMWLPVSDIAEEGVPRWWDGQTITPYRTITGVQERLAAFRWYTQATEQNEEDYDCLVWGVKIVEHNPEGVYMNPCNGKRYPMICYKEG
ncbi:unnamed protein product [Meganyctiphanes norvegica]|uniref:C-type lectin domain-containing protein n=1 Tax=Meganyctiphanes norvegica TaxID=48144 RepID=A0AAV2QKG6_MEGNR